MSLLKRVGIPVFAILLLPSLALAQYTVTNLVSNQPGVAPATDSQHLINAWGLVSLPTSPFWVSDNGTGFSTLYNGAGKRSHLFVIIPPASNASPGTLGSPTGIVGNISPNATDFVVKDPATGKSGKASFIFATLDGTISGWSFPVGGLNADGTSHATLMVDRSGDGASYTGLAIGFATINQVGQFLLYAADGGPNRRVDVYNSNFEPVQLPGTPFSDPMIPKTFTTYGIQNINGDIWVTYTALNKAQGGFVDHFAPDGTLIAHAAVRGPLHSPWGLAKAPADFGPMSNAILVGNNTSRGRINAFDPNTGDFLGPLLDTNGVPIEIDQLWAIQFGKDGAANGAHNQLFFTAGSNQYNDGLFGMVTLAPQ